MVVGSTVLALLTSGVTNPAAASKVGSAGASAAAVKWQACSTGSKVQCATVEVPRDYDEPAGATTKIALARLPAKGAASQRLGALFVNPGGPGGSGVDFVQAAEPLYASAVLERYDIVGFDPRGVARSDPATCFGSNAEKTAYVTDAQPYPITTPQERHFIRQTAELSLRCQANSPERFSTSSTANVARDLDRLRQYVGDSRLTYAGYSYGTYLGATYAALFPNRVGRLVLDAPVDPAAWSGTGKGDASVSVPLGVRVRQGAGATETFAEFVRLCRAAGSGCALNKLGDPRRVVEATLHKLLRAPVRIPLEDGTVLTVTQQFMVEVLFFGLYSPALWPDLADLVAELARPQVRPAEVAAAIAGTRSVSGARLRGEDYPSIGGALASLCVDTVNSRHVWRYPQVADAENAKYPYFGRYRAWTGLPCEFWGVRDEDRFIGPWRQKSTAPVLVIGTRFDPATPYRQAAPYARLFPRGVLLTLNGWGHSGIGKSRCVDAVVAGYLLRGNVPARGATCRPDTVPFKTPRRDLANPRPDVPPGLPLR